jgi:hypothetical protein
MQQLFLDFLLGTHFLILHFSLVSQFLFDDFGFYIYIFFQGLSNFYLNSFIYSNIDSNLTSATCSTFDTFYIIPIFHFLLFCIFFELFQLRLPSIQFSSHYLCLSCSSHSLSSSSNISLSKDITIKLFITVTSFHSSFRLSHPRTFFLTRLLKLSPFFISKQLPPPTDLLLLAHTVCIFPSPHSPVN